VRELFEKDILRVRHRMESAPNGYVRLVALLDLMTEELINEPAMVRYMAQFDAMYARAWPAERLIMLESQINPEGAQALSDLICEGITDGSLRSDLDPDLTLHAVLDAAIGTQRRLASLGSKVEKEYGKTIDSLFCEAVRVLLLGLRAQEPAPKRTP